MNLDDEICYCYHVPLRKLLAFARREQPQRPSQMSNCLGAGTGCGWCIPILKRIRESCVANNSDASGSPDFSLPQSAQEYATGRREYLKSTEKNEF